MYQTDFEEFSKLMGRMAEVFGKKPSNDLVQAYWGALKDQPLSTVSGLAASHIRISKFFPKPFELRPRSEAKVVRDTKADADFKAAEARCIANLEELGRQDPQKWEKEVRIRKLDRLVAITHESHPAYPGILNEWRASRGIHVGQKEIADARIP